MTKIQGNQGNKNIKMSKKRISSGIKPFNKENYTNTREPKE